MASVISSSVRTTYRSMTLIAAMCLTVPYCFAQTPVYKINISNHLFEPSLLVIPAHTKVKLIINNLDKAPEEFESFELNREKVIMGQRTGVVFIGPLEPGEYPFFGEFNPKSAQGVIVAE